MLLELQSNRLHDLHARQVKSLKPGILIEHTRVRKGVPRFIRDTCIMHPSFVCIAQKVNRAKLIDDENILKRMSFLLAAVIQLSVNFVAWTANGTFYAVMDKKGGASVACDGSSCDGSSCDGSSCDSSPCNRRTRLSAVRAGRRLDFIKICFDFRTAFCVSAKFGSYAARNMFP